MTILLYINIYLIPKRTCRLLATSPYMKVSCSAPVVLPQLRPDFHGNSKINRQTHQCNVFLIESARSSLLINGHTVIIICCQFTTKFFLFLDWYNRDRECAHYSHIEPCHTGQSRKKSPDYHSPKDSSRSSVRQNNPCNDHHSCCACCFKTTDFCILTDKTCYCE